jgi:putative restriction endonuclease
MAYAHGVVGRWAEHFALPDEVSASTQLVEGAVCRVTVNAYERNPEARRRCIAAHGTTCCICGFSFGTAYGPEAAGYIHVHHVRPLSDIGSEYVVDPVKDLRPVCPNCHAVLHLGGYCRTIDEVCVLLAAQRQAKPPAAVDPAS